MHSLKAVIITIGDELLIGQIIDTNSAWIAQQLNLLGIDICKRIAIADTKEAITNTLHSELANADIVLITGGLGPTADDVTKPVLCDFFGGKLIVNEAVLAHVKGIFERRGRPMLARNLMQAEVPDVCTVLHNAQGTAPGMLFEQDDKIVISMPGVPFEMKGIMTDAVLPLLRNKYEQVQAIVHCNILTFGEGESFLAEKIKDIENALPSHIQLAYLPSPYAVKLRLTAHGSNEQRLRIETEHYRNEIAQRVAANVISLEDLPLEQIVGNALLAKNKYLGLAESCTGGYIAHKITQVNGSSRYFKGCVVSYATQCKIDILGIDPVLIKSHGVVSEAVAVAMAKAACQQLRSDIGLGITGIFSASDYEDQSPVGTVFIAVAGNGKVLAKQYQLHHDRLQNKETATQIALYMIWEFLTKTIV
ncbi:MAG: CinA family nicotinamide mononucleotide deamidase-related protein [Chitinophagaceae bacterium]|nr:CinA family nicotinamide mononucleotide deamidase-related protein [Chitinophagaceae bacterium]